MGIWRPLGRPSDKGRPFRLKALGLQPLHPELWRGFTYSVHITCRSLEIVWIRALAYSLYASPLRMRGGVRSEKKLSCGQIEPANLNPKP